MSYVEAIEYQSPLQVQAHRERIERLRRLGGTPKQVIRFRPKPVAVVIEAPQQEEPAQAIPAISEQPAEIVVSGVNITAQPAVGLVPVGSLKKIAPIASIQRFICSRYGISMTDLNGKLRTAKVVTPRQIAMYLCRKVTSRSLPEIGRKFGERDHTTVLHSVQKIESMMANSPEFAKEVQAIAKAIETEAWT